MSKRKDDNAPESSTHKKRSRQQLPTFRPIRTSKPNFAHQRSTMLRTNQTGRLGQRKTDKEVALEPEQVLLSQNDSSLFLEVDISDAPNDPASDSKLHPDEAKTTRKRNNKVSDKLREWLNYRESYLRELLRHEGLGDHDENSKCTSCSAAS
ncbi:hypothetical protein H0H92_012375, partial [Tricholoma furcatifolium]